MQRGQIVTGICGSFLCSITQEVVSIRLVVFAVLPEVRGEVGDSWKGTKERRILGRARKKARKKKTLSITLRRAQRQHVPQSDCAMKAMTEVTSGKGYSSFPLLFFFLI